MNQFIKCSQKTGQEQIVPFRAIDMFRTHNFRIEFKLLDQICLFYHHTSDSIKKYYFFDFDINALIKSSSLLGMRIWPENPNRTEPNLTWISNSIRFSGIYIRLIRFSGYSVRVTRIRAYSVQKDRTEYEKSHFFSNCMIAYSVLCSIDRYPKYPCNTP